MNNPVITAVRQNFDNLKTANILRKAEIAEDVLEGVLSILTDFENRLNRLEDQNGGN